MFYWRIKHPNKSWLDWSSGTAETLDEVKQNALDSIIDEDGSFWALGCNVDVWEMVDIDDIRLKPEDFYMYKKSMF